MNMLQVQKSLQYQKKTKQKKNFYPKSTAAANQNIWTFDILAQR